MKNIDMLIKWLEFKSISKVIYNDIDLSEDIKELANKLKNEPKDSIGE